MPGHRPLLTHRPFGIEHPYASSSDQRLPVRPESGEEVRLGVIALEEVTAVRCEWHAVDDARVILDLRPGQVAAADAAALAGGDGHLAEAQAAALADDGAWVTSSPPVT